MKLCLGLTIAFSIGLISCTKRCEVTRITVQADSDVEHIRVTPCVAGAPDPTVLDQTESGTTAACPLGDVVVLVVAPTKSIEIPAEKVQVLKAADGKPVMIFADVPQVK